MPKAKRLPSGSWRVQVLVGRDENGKRIMQSITAGTKKEAEYQASLVIMGLAEKKKKPEAATLSDAIDLYIKKYDGLLSPTTVRGYRSIQRNNVQGIMKTPLTQLDENAIQAAISADSKRLAPKTIRNIYNLILPALREYHPNLYDALKKRPARLPQDQPKEQHAYEPEEIKELFSAIRGKKIEVPVLLALWLCMSRSEILGLTWDDVDFQAHTLRVEKSRVVDVDGKTVIKPTKNRYRTRTLTMPEYIEKVLAQARETATSEFICPMHPNTISKDFKKLCERNGIRPLRFHDLRHSSASVMIALNIPFFYAQRRGGWASDNMLQRVYGHQLEAKRNEFDDRIDAFFDGLNDENDEEPV